jgi:hypothetical protein
MKLLKKPRQQLIQLSGKNLEQVAYRAQINTNRWKPTEQWVKYDIVTQLVCPERRIDDKYV